MRTVQEYLGELDVQRLLDHFSYDYPIDYELLPRKDLPVSQIKQRYRDRMAQFIDLLRGLAIEKNDGDHIGILFAYKCIGYRNAGRSIDFGLVHADDAVEKGTGAPVYCYELTGLEEIAGFFVADNAFTQKHLYELLSDLLHQASFFGLDKDERKKAIDDALRSFEEAEKEKSIPWEEVKREFQEKYGLEFDEDTPEEQQLRSAAYTAAHAFDEHCMKKEMSSIIDTLRRMRRS